MAWERGKEAINGMVARKDLLKVNASLEMSKHLLDKSEEAIKSCEVLCNSNLWYPASTLVWDATRFALASLLQAQGLRYSDKGSHSIIIEAATYQFQEVMGRQLRQAKDMLRSRNENAYPDVLTEVDSDDVLKHLEIAKEIHEMSQKMVTMLTVF